MATTRTERRATFSSDDLETILSRVLTAAQVKPPEKPDPTLNVKEQLDKAVAALTDVIERDRQHTVELRSEKEKADKNIDALRDKLAEKESARLDAIAAAERIRTDAQFLNVANALTLATEKQSAQQATIAAQLVTTAEVLRASAQAEAQRTQAAIRTLEQNQFQTGGVSAGVRQQQGDARSTSAAVYAAVGFIISLLLFGMAAVAFIIARLPPAAP